MSETAGSQQAFFRDLLTKLNASGIAYMVSGSVASSVHGEPRATNDLDLVVDPDSDSLEYFLKIVPINWYISPEAAREALGRRTMFNIIDTESGWKADLIVRKDRPYSAEEFRRRTRAEILGQSVELVSVEDSILSKLEWSVESESQRQFLDALGVARQAGDHLDREYLLRWASAIGVADSLNKLFQELEN